MAGAAQGRAQADGVLVAETADANRLHNKTLCGQPMPGNQLRLGWVEAAWCMAQGRLDVVDGTRPLPFADLLRRAGPRGEVEYLAYADLRDRGLAVRTHEGAFMVLPRGSSSAQSAAADHTVHVRSERDAVTGSDLRAWAQAGAVLALVDEDGAVTHYALSLEKPTGTVLPGRLARSTGTILSDRVLVDDPVAAKEFHEHEFMGTPHGSLLFLSFTEAEALRQRGILQLSSDLPHAAARSQLHFERTLPVYQALRSAGVVAKSGFRFGTHLRGYVGDPDHGHAEWLVHCLGDGTHWSEVSRGVRLAHGVRKHFLVATGNPVAFVGVTWLRV